MKAQPPKKSEAGSSTYNPWNVNPYSKKQYNQQDVNKLPPAQQDAVKAKLDEIKKKKSAASNNQTNTNDLSDGNEGEDVNVTNKETKGNARVQMDEEQEKIYGMTFFADANYTLGNDAIVTPPSSYRIGSGDELVVNIWGPSEEQFNYEVGRDGSIYPKYIGKISVGGLSFANAKQIIISKFKKHISAGSNIDVQLGKARSIKVTVMGEVKKPGTVTVGAFNTALSVIAFAGGPTRLANLREIEIKRNGNVVNSIDLYEFIKSGGSLDDIYMDDGDVVNISVHDKIVSAIGSFKRPMNYILKKDETLDDLINFAGGPSFDARYSNIQVRTIFNEQPKLISVNMNVYDEAKKTLVLFDGDEVKINKVNESFTNTVEVIGAVAYPDIYQVSNGEKLLDVLAKAGGLESNAMISRAYVYRGDENNSTAFKINLNSLGQDDADNMEILPGDKISIISKSEFTTGYTLDVMGSVRKPGSIKFIKNLKLKDALILSGGLTTEAENGRIEIVSITDSSSQISLNLKNQPVIKTVEINPDLEIDASSEEIILQAYDKIYVRKKSDFNLIKKIMLKGEIKYPGEYALLSESETISSLINRAGGLTKNAYPEGAELKRTELGIMEKQLISKEANSFVKKTVKDTTIKIDESVVQENQAIIKDDKITIIINLRNAIDNPNSKFDAKLKESDEITIPGINETVTILGSIQNPSTFNFSDEVADVQSLIDAAGGFGHKAWKRKITVHYPNGVARKVKNYGLFRLYPNLKPGSVVTVPARPEKENKEGKSGNAIAVIAGLATTLTSVFALIATITKTP
jgi:protein involved in polysaccharide export with SLBB domain